jgi:mono/diheme cytochrome c family protein
MHVRSLILSSWILSLALSVGCEGWPPFVPAAEAASESGDVERGRSLFNGKGVCSSCHGIDVNLAKRPPLNEQTAAVIGKLSPPPADLRTPDRLRLLSEQQRFKAIRKGHPGTGMLPDPSLTDQEITDILAYLARLRSEGPVKSQ